MGSWTTWFLDFNGRVAWNKRGGAKFGPFLINVVAEITELWVENSQKINCRDVTSIQGEENGTTFQSGLRFQTSLSSLLVWCKRAHCNALIKTIIKYEKWKWKCYNKHVSLSTIRYPCFRLADAIRWNSTTTGDW